MSLRVVNIGSAPNTGEGDTLRNGMNKVNLNFTDIENHIANAVTTSDLSTSSSSNTVVQRDTDGNFSANTITSNIIGNVSGSADRLANSITLTANGDVSGSTIFDGSTDFILDLTIANSSQLQAETGTNNSTFMTPLRTKQLIENGTHTLKNGLLYDADDDGTFNTGTTYTPDPTTSSFKKINNAGNFTIQAPSISESYFLAIYVNNISGSGTISFSGFDFVDVPPPPASGTTTSYCISITKVHTFIQAILSRVT